MLIHAKILELQSTFLQLAETQVKDMKDQYLDSEEEDEEDDDFLPGDDAAVELNHIHCPQSNKNERHQCKHCYRKKTRDAKKIANKSSFYCALCQKYLCIARLEQRPEILGQVAFSFAFQYKYSQNNLK
jgi:formamidopyrimidine-DNA glycosylase